MARQELELYLHIPFCVSKCAYCDFLSAPADDKTQEEYVYALEKEIKGYGQDYRSKYEVMTIFIGGGTPSILSEHQISVIFKALHNSFRIAGDAEITIEVNPGTATAKKMKAWKRAGINRLSIGLQSADDKELKMLGRIHDFDTFKATYSLAREAGFHNINIDLISAIPGQTVESWKATLTKAAELNPEHISAYSLIIEEGTPFHERYGSTLPAAQADKPDKKPSHLPPLPDEDTERAIYETTDNLLRQYGYQRYEISNYSKKGFACRHNKGYWQRKEYLGIGLGSSSLINHTRYRNTADYKTYIHNIQNTLPIKEDIEPLSITEEIEEYLFLGLREMQGISLSNFQETFGHSMLAIYRTEIKKLERANLLQITDDTITLTKRGIDISNTVFTEFLDPKI